MWILFISAYENYVSAFNRNCTITLLHSIILHISQRILALFHWENDLISASRHLRLLLISFDPTQAKYNSSIKTLKGPHILPKTQTDPINSSEKERAEFVLSIRWFNRIHFVWEEENLINLKKLVKIF